ncbi:hypothetical protein C7212DRAFT_114838, partial [Tuber magnatum]
MHNLETVLQELGRYDEAEELHRRELESCEKALGPEHPDTLLSRSGLASVLNNQGKHTEAEAIK